MTIPELKPVHATSYTALHRTNPLTRQRHLMSPFMYVLAGLTLALAHPLLSYGEAVPPAGPLDSVRGQGCYTYGDTETPAHAKKAALALAQEQAVKSYRVYVQSSSTVKNFQLEDDLIQSASVGVLQDVQIEKQEKKEQEICIAITAKISPVKMENLIQQKTTAKDVAQTAAAPLVASSNGFGLKVWTNKMAGDTYVEGEPMIISVQSDRDAYLKLDYYQADGTVVHVVPNVFGGQAFIRAGQTQSFGGAGSMETFTVSEPFGAETIKAIASTKPFDQALTASKNVEESRDYLGHLQLATRGLKMTQGTQQWAETAASVTTSSKAAAEHHDALSGVRGAKKQP